MACHHLGGAAPAAPLCVQMLLERKMAAPNKTGPVFASRVVGRLSHRNVQRRGFDLAADDACIDATFHDLSTTSARGSRPVASPPARSPTQWATGAPRPPSGTSHASTARSPTSVSERPWVH